MTLDLSIEVNIECNHDRHNYEKDNNLLSLNELLFDIEEAQESHRAQSRNKYEIRETNNVIEHSTQNDCNHASILKSKQCEDKSKNIDSNNNLHLNSDASTFEKQNKRRYFFSTLSTIIDLETKYNS